MMPLFSNILMPVDGALTMVPAVRQCLRLAAAIGARVYALHVIEAGTHPQAGVVPATPEQLTSRGNRILEQVAREAREAGVPCECHLVEAHLPWQAIVDAAREGQIDLICMLSHSRVAAPGSVLGSQTAQVVRAASVPVLVLR